MNVLFYLGRRRRAKKEKLLGRPAGTGWHNDLHDGKYSLADGRLGYDWAFQNFRMLNPWVSIKGRRTPREEKLRFYETQFPARPTETNLGTGERRLQFLGAGHRRPALACATSSRSIPIPFSP